MAYGPVPVLEGVSLSIPEGGVAAVLGGGRTGKTTLLRAISGLLRLHGGRVTQGRVELAGEPLGGRTTAEVVRLGVAHVLQGRRLFRDLTVEENLRAGGNALPDRATVRRQVEGTLGQFPLLDQRRTTPAGYLSGGEQQLLAIARALMSRPRLVLLDEPSLGLAPAAIEQVACVLTDVAASGASVLIAESKEALASSTAQSTLWLDRVAARA